MTDTLTRVHPDLFQTRTDSPFPGLTTHAYLWTGGPEGNVLFYSTASDAEFDAIAGLGGIAHQYLSHLDEAGPMLGRIARRFGSRLHAPGPNRPRSPGMLRSTSRCPSARSTRTVWR